MMTIYDRATKMAYALNARETAPAALTSDIFSDNHELTQRGALAVGVPGELAGYWEAHKKFGRLPWAALLEPTIKICRDGYNMSKHQFDSLGFRPKNIFNDELLKELFVNPSTGKFYRQGSKIVQHQYCKTLEVIAEYGAHTLYNGSLARLLVQDIHQMGGIITHDDLQNYRQDLKTENIYAHSTPHLRDISETSLRCVCAIWVVSKQKTFPNLANY